MTIFAPRELTKEEQDRFATAFLPRVQAVARCHGRSDELLNELQERSVSCCLATLRMDGSVHQPEIFRHRLKGSPFMMTTLMNYLTVKVGLRIDKQTQKGSRPTWEV